MEKFLQKQMELTQSLWGNQFRDDARNRCLSLGLPSHKQESWKYTRVDLLNQDWNFSKKTPNIKKIIDQSSLESLSESSTANLVFVNGKYQESLSKVPKDKKSIELFELSELLDKEETKLEHFLNKFHENPENPFIALNSAYLEEGVLIEVKEVLASPISIVFINTDEGVKLFQHPRILLHAQKNSHAKLVETHYGDQNIYWSNQVSQIALEENAFLEHYLLQMDGQRSCYFNSIDVKQDRFSTYHSFQFCLGAQLARSEIVTELQGEGAHSILDGLYLAHDSQHVDFQTRIDHQVAHTFSDELYKGILSDHGKAIFNGSVIVRPDAQKIKSSQDNRNLLLSDNSKVYTRPNLEIYADDVKCSHGATTGRLDQEALFYLQSRGINREKARLILTNGFAQEIVSRVNIPELRPYLIEQIDLKLGWDRVVA